MLSATPNKPVGTPLSPVYRVVSTQSRRSDAFLKPRLNIQIGVFFFFLGERKGYKTFTSPPKQNTLFGVSAPRSKKALIASHLETLHFSFISLFFGASATACDADGSLSRLLGVPPREQLLQLTGSVSTGPGHSAD